jgi:hypothetical protein
MDMRKGPMKYVEGGTLKSEKDVGPPMGIGGVGGTPGDEVTRGISIAPEEAPKKKKKKKKRKKTDIDVGQTLKRLNDANFDTGEFRRPEITDFDELTPLRDTNGGQQRLMTKSENRAMEKQKAERDARIDRLTSANYRGDKKPKKKPVKKNMGGMMKYKKGGTVRGYGMAKGGRPCKMVKMKGS